MKTAVIAIATGALGFATVAQAEIVDSGHGGFASSHSALVDRDRSEVWDQLVHPEDWWSHSWSDDSTNLTLDPLAGGCFCERIPATGPMLADGSAEHARVVMVQPGAMLRMVGSLGPLQSEGLSGTLTVTLTEEEGGTRIAWEYVIGGQSRFDLAAIGSVVDGVQAEFLGGLVAALGGAVDGQGG